MCDVVLDEFIEGKRLRVECEAKAEDCERLGFHQAYLREPDVYYQWDYPTPNGVQIRTWDALRPKRKAKGRTK